MCSESFKFFDYLENTIQDQISGSFNYTTTLLLVPKERKNVKLF